MKRQTLQRALALFAGILLSTSAPTQPVEIEFEGAGGFKLAGELLMPETDGQEPVAAALLLPGSGPSDRNGNQPPYLTTDVLKQIAERLAKEGVATFRFDKRAAGVHAAQWPQDLEAMNETFSFENFVADARAAFMLLQEHEGVDPRRVSIVGHSEGGLIALNIAHEMRDREDRPHSLVLVATAGRTLDVVIREQISRMMGVQGADEQTQDEYLAALDGAIETVKLGEEVPSGLPAGLAPLFNPSVMNILRSYFTIDPADLAASVVGPVLVLQGASDVQVSAERDAPRLKEALAGREGETTELVLIKSASHNLKSVNDDSEPGFEGPVLEEALAAIARWLSTDGE